ncbi:PD-(D/E)XK nuclease domain-containing protein [Butyrivibrio fibrisolvens]|uniref:PD-(D/E)XK nuclease domain-containing protein n=1 Tax=Butyrivibrio fibrisolvens TaxID=831 RepID=UPI000557609A|nr:PD-(D/E)XK nuclease domain-containing protein [Butyrivibrio fibrisolvens]
MLSYRSFYWTIKLLDIPLLHPDNYVVELKWNESVQTALDQIRKRKYPDKLKDRGEGILLVGISYDKDDKEKI